MKLDAAPLGSPQRDIPLFDAISPSGTPLRRITSEQLIGSAREVLIRHAGCDYRLRITRQGKLILTK